MITDKVNFANSKEKQRVKTAETNIKESKIFELFYYSKLAAVYICCKNTIIRYRFALFPINSFYRLRVMCSSFRCVQW